MSGSAPPLPTARDVKDLLDLPRATLRSLLQQGHAIDPHALDNWEYRGTALGLPRFVERLSWKTFQKVFLRDPARSVLRGWNVRVQQRGIGASSQALQRRGQPITFGHYHVVPLRPDDSPWPIASGLLIDYGCGQNRGFDPMGLVRDPIVALQAGSADLLLGWSYVALGPLRIPTPSFFALERERALSYDVPPPAARST
jgi:hypothetical protein